MNTGNSKLTTDQEDNQNSLQDLGLILTSGLSDCHNWSDLDELLSLLASPNIAEAMQLDTPVCTEVKTALGEALLRASQSEERGTIRLDRDVLGKAAHFFHLCGWTVEVNTHWEAVFSELLRLIGTGTTDPDGQTDNVISTICLHSILHGRETALDDLFCWLREERFIWCDNFDLIGLFLWQHEFYANVVDAERIAQWTDISTLLAVADDVNLFDVSLNMLQALCFDKTSPEPWLRMVYNAAALPILLSTLEHDRFNAALALETLIYSVWLMKIETADHYEESFQQWVPQMITAGKKFADQNPPPNTHLTGNAGDKPIVGFIVPAAGNLAHIDFMFSALQGLKALGAACPLVPRVYVLNGHSKKMAARCADVGAEVVWLSLIENDSVLVGLDPTNVTTRLLQLRERLAQDNVTAAIWLSVLPMMAFAFELRLAPVQIWLSVRFWPSAFTNTDGNIAVAAELSDANETRVLFGREWRTVPCIFENLSDVTKEPAAEQIRETFREKHDLLIGTISREEKADNDRFLYVVSEILKAKPNVGFIYSGRNPRQNIHDYFEREGVGDQCTFVGWVDTKLYARVLDIFLSAWPIGSGLTIYESMAASKPVVHFHGDGTIMDWIEQEIIGAGTDDLEMYTAYMPLITGEKSNQDYIDHVTRLIEQPELRHQEGKISKSFADENLSNIPRLGQSMANQILNIIDESQTV